MFSTASFQHTNQIYIYIFCWAVGMFMQRFWCVGADRWPKLKVLITLVRYISRCMCFSILIITKPLFVCVCVVYMQNRLFVLQSRIDIAGHALAGTPFLFDLNLAPVKFYSWWNCIDGWNLACQPWWLIYFLLVYNTGLIPCYRGM